MFQTAKADLDAVKSQVSPLKCRLQNANNASEIIDYSAPVERVSKLLDNTESLSEDVDDKIQWLTGVMMETAELNTDVADMQEWLPKAEETAKGLGPMSTDLDLIKDQIKSVEVRSS